MRSSYPQYPEVRVSWIAQQPEQLTVMEIQRVSWSGAGTTSVSASFITSAKRIRRRNRGNKPPTKIRLLVLLLPLLRLVSKWLVATEFG